MTNLSEADTCRKYVLPKLYASRVDGRSDQRADNLHRRSHRGLRQQNNAAAAEAGGLSCFGTVRDFTLAVVEAKAAYQNAADALQQAKEYAQMLGLKFAYATNGHGIIEHDFLTGRDAELEVFPSPDELWSRLREQEGISEAVAASLLTPYYHLSGRSPRYYQEIAINRASPGHSSKAAARSSYSGHRHRQDRRRLPDLLETLEHTLESHRRYRRPRILYLADRNILIDDPKDKTFAPFGDARCKIEGEAIKSREMYFATYQAIATDERRPGLYRDYPTRLL